MFPAKIGERRKQVTARYYDVCGNVTRPNVMAMSVPCLCYYMYQGVSSNILNPHASAHQDSHVQLKVQFQLFYSSRTRTPNFYSLPPSCSLARLNTFFHWLGKVNYLGYGSTLVVMLAIGGICHPICFIYIIKMCKPPSVDINLVPLPPSML